MTGVSKLSSEPRVHNTTQMTSLSQRSVSHSLSSIACIAIIGKLNNPLLVKCLDSSVPERDFHLLCYSACDVFDERSSKTDSYFGLLLCFEDYAAYGYQTNTKNKIIIIFNHSDAAIKDQEVKSAFKEIHEALIGLSCNPFFIIDEKQGIKSTKFESKIEQVAAKWTKA
ncbi:Trafficking protein particle complex subunit 2-like protein [Neolecta irregularis DAH-3]|uniref:Trafficking protein particle complex subunit 2-like protein n=1 Tax=Neolecta irregularis (strain DAH-3) TaxID=1198029 RepID=A0A1U7LID9_NEOID|nr:Trafficking protein particle complex subunit 2-like protein [Neolecta irregularis DAH-3]|eukprot:OLL22426.1 Trafficking protein particle complex subunit 2-like protein [Neolecta irregularis DAH-3]